MYLFVSLLLLMVFTVLYLNVRRTLSLSRKNNGEKYRYVIKMFLKGGEEYTICLYSNTKRYSSDDVKKEIVSTARKKNHGLVSAKENDLEISFDISEVNYFDLEIQENDSTK